MLANTPLAAYRLSPGFVTTGIVTAMRLEPWLLETVIYVGHETPIGQFVPYGSGFLCTWLFDKYRANLIVTAAHVIDDVPGDTISYRLNRKDSGTKVISVPKSAV